MAKLDRIFAPAARFGQRARPEDFGTGVGLQTLGNAIGDAAEAGAALLEADQNSAVLSATNEATVALDEHNKKYKDGLPNVLPGGHKEYQDEYDRERDKIVDSFADGIFSEAHKEKYRNRIFPTSRRGQLDIKTAIQDNIIDGRKAGLDEAEITQSNLIATADTPEQAEEYRRNYTDMLANAIADGVIDEQESGVRMRKLESRVRDAVLQRLINADPSGAVQFLRDREPDGKGKNFPDMPEAERIAWIEKAQDEYESHLRTLIAVENHSRVVENDRRDRLRETTSRKAINEIVSGKNGLTVSWVIENRVALDTNYGKYMKIAQQGGRIFERIRDDPGVYISLADLAHSGTNRREFKQMLEGAFTEGLIGKESFDQLDSRFDTKQFGDARDYLSDKLRVGEAVESISGRSRRAEAVAEFEDWVMRHPDADRSDAFNKVRRIARGALLLSDDNTFLRLSPEYGVRSPKGIDVEKTKADTIRGYARLRKINHLSDEEQMEILRSDPDFQIQLRRIAEWELAQIARGVGESIDKEGE